jgi:hypothetical protein
LDKQNKKKKKKKTTKKKINTDNKIKEKKIIKKIDSQSVCIRPEIHGTAHQIISR